MEIKNCEQYIVLDISLELGCLENRKFKSSVPRDYLGKSIKRMTTSMNLRTKRSNKKQKARFSITDITNQAFRNFLKKFKNSPYLGYKSKKVHNEATEAYFFLIKQITKLIKSKRHVRLCPNVLTQASTKNYTRQQSNTI